MDEAGYNDPSWEYDIYNREWLEQFKKTNNKYYFVIWHDPEYAYFKLGY
jgi:hypothetical protein